MNVLILLRRSQAKKYVGIPYGHSWVFWSIVYYVPRVGLPSGHYWVFWSIVHYFPQIVRNHLIFSTEFLSTCLFLFLPACLSACLSACLPVCLCVCLSVCLSVCPSVRSTFFSGKVHYLISFFWFFYNDTWLEYLKTDRALFSRKIFFCSNSTKNSPKWPQNTAFGVFLKILSLFFPDNNLKWKLIL